MIAKKSLKNDIEAEMTFNFDPGTSWNLIGTSLIGIEYSWAKYSISTSKAHLTRCILNTILCAANLENNLNPHCVSFMFLIPIKY